MARPNKSMNVVSTQYGGQVAEAVCFVPNVQIVEDSNGGKKLMPIL